MIITGTLFRDMCISAANALENNKEELNNLNVFPVPDGDTGINMSMTLRTLSTELRDFEGTISECAEKVARVALRAARGNSGVILSLFFRGLAKELHGLEEADSIHMARAFKTGVAEAYRAVMTPTEGTILTVMRVSADRAIERAETDFAGKVESLFAYMVVVAIETLQKTPELLPALKLAHVVDAGGAGFVKMIEGMLLALQGAPVELKAGAIEDKEGASAFEAFSTEDIKFGYCTECIVEKDAAHRGEGTAEEFRQLVMSIGDSVVFVDDEEIIKVHVHTNNPDRVLNKALKYGDLATVKIENMRNQHSALLEKSEEADAASEAEEESVAPTKDYGFVTVCMGDGMKDMFEQLGADRIVFGGQTMNPSMEQMLEAIRKTPAHTVFVLPNNKNIYMVSEQAAAEVSDRRVIVLGTRSVPEGIAAMLAFDENIGADENEEMMKEAVAVVTTLQVTYAVREFSFEGEEFPEGKALGLKNGKIAVVADDRDECLAKLLETLDDPACITVFCGADVDEECAARTEETVSNRFADVELTVVSGGQPLYDFVVSVE
ncbi:MAG: DAK2 domain-containing protein [Clostridia bacterium]|nr:DAK2 domain-containing protein [Clostridia bacterium]